MSADGKVVAGSDQLVEPMRRPALTREAVVAAARSCLGTPFAHGQALRGVGCDCIGLLVIVGQALGMPEYARWQADGRFKGYTRVPNPELLLRGCAEYLTEIPVSRAGLGDILQYTFAREPMHFAIVSRENPRYVIHSYERARFVVENGSTATFWRLQRAFRFPGVA